MKNKINTAHSKAKHAIQMPVVFSSRFIIMNKMKEKRELICTGFITDYEDVQGRKKMKPSNCVVSTHP